MSWFDFGAVSSIMSRTPAPRDVEYVLSKRDFCIELWRACREHNHISGPVQPPSAFIDRCSKGLPKGNVTRVSPVDGYQYNIFPKGNQVISRAIGPATDNGIRQALQVSARNLADKNRCDDFNGDGPGSVVIPVARPSGSRSPASGAIASAFSALGNAIVWGTTAAAGAALFLMTRGALPRLQAPATPSLTPLILRDRADIPEA